MIYCINPQCDQRQNSEQLTVCHHCATPLLIQERYQLLRPLRDRTLYCNAEVFESADRHQPEARKIIKVLINADPKLIQLFQQEQRLLTNPQLHHPGIPRGEAAFSVLVGDRKLRCLVMERIEGQDLETWITITGTISEAQARNWLQQITEILAFVHGNRLFHRDIKPANIMRKLDGHLVLIDFGTARQMTETIVTGSQSTRVSSYGYTAPEQEQGRTVPQSDFYALGKTFIHLLTGQHPTSSALETHDWNRLTPYPLSSALVGLINRLVQFNPQHRPRSAQAILWQLQWLEAARHWRWMAAAMVVAGLGGWMMGKYSLIERTVGLVMPPPACDLQLADALSCGEEMLTPKAISQEKREALKAWRNGDYREAEQQLSKARSRDKSDPETLIYLNNARIINRQVNAKTIAVAVPLNSPDAAFNRGLEMLRGVAQAQDEAFQAGVYIKVLIGDDANDDSQTKIIAQAFSRKSEILAVIGHYASEITRSALAYYQDAQLVVISPTSTSTDLSSPQNQPQHVFFRTVSTTQRAAQSLVAYFDARASGQKVAVFYNPNSEFSRSLRHQFDLSILPKQRQITPKSAEFNLNQPNFDTTAALKRVRQENGGAIALFPDGHTDRNAFDNSLKLLDAINREAAPNQRSLLVLGDSVLYSNDVLRKIAPEVWPQLVVSVPWHYSENPQFSQAARDYWGGNVNYNTATAYDAVRVILKALEKQPRDRVALQAILADADFVTTGATGDIRFVGSDRREVVTTLVKVMNCSKPVFVPIEMMTCPSN